jgi:hypothetical protein
MSMAACTERGDAVLFQQWHTRVQEEHVVTRTTVVVCEEQSNAAAQQEEAIATVARVSHLC